MSNNLLKKKAFWTHKRTFDAIRYAAIIILGLLTVLPIIFLLSGSFMSIKDASAYPPKLFPPTLHPENYVKAIEYLTARTIINSFIFVLGILLCQLTLSLTAGFALAKMPFKYASALVGLFAIPLFLPTNVSIIPLYLVTFKLGLLNSWAGMILPIVGSTAFGTLLFRQFFVNFPDGLIDAARIDGASWPRVMLQIVVPLSKPPIASYSAITFLTAWNMYIWPLLVGTRDTFRVLTVQLAPIVQGGGGVYSEIPPNVAYAAAFISSLPVMVVFLFAQRWFINAIAGTGNDS